MDEPLFAIGLVSSALLWLIMPLIVRRQPLRPTHWRTWWTHRPMGIQLLGHGLITGMGAAGGMLLVSLLTGRPLTIAPLLYAVGYLIGTLVVGGWQVWRGRLPRGLQGG